jgi:hypothetical protein
VAFEEADDDEEDEDVYEDTELQPDEEPGRPPNGQGIIQQDDDEEEDDEDDEEEYSDAWDYHQELDPYDARDRRSQSHYGAQPLRYDDSQPAPSQGRRYASQPPEPEEDPWAMPPSHPQDDDDYEEEDPYDATTTPDSQGGHGQDDDDGEDYDDDDEDEDPYDVTTTPATATTTDDAPPSPTASVDSYGSFPELEDLTVDEETGLFNGLDIPMSQLTLEDPPGSTARATTRDIAGARGRAVPGAQTAVPGAKPAAPGVKMAAPVAAAKSNLRPPMALTERLSRVWREWLFWCPRGCRWANSFCCS